jgi:hypothetical protein
MWGRAITRLACHNHQHQCQQAAPICQCGKMVSHVVAPLCAGARFLPDYRAPVARGPSSHAPRGALCLRPSWRLSSARDRDIQDSITPAYQPTDVFAGVLLTAVRMIDTGTTAMVDTSWSVRSTPCTMSPSAMSLRPTANGQAVSCRSDAGRVRPEGGAPLFTAPP